MQSYPNYPFYGQPVYQQGPYAGQGPPNGYPPFNYSNNPAPFNMPRPETHNEQAVIPPPQPPQTSRPKSHRRTNTIPAPSGSYPLKSALKRAAAAMEDPQPANPTLSRANALTRSRTYSNPTNPVIGTDLAFRPRLYSSVNGTHIFTLGSFR